MSVFWQKQNPTKSKSPQGYNDIKNLVFDKLNSFFLSFIFNQLIYSSLQLLIPEYFSNSKHMDL